MRNWMFAALLLAPLPALAQEKRALEPDHPVVAPGQTSDVQVGAWLVGPATGTSCQAMIQYGELSR